MEKKVRIGVLGGAKIALTQVIPAIRSSKTAVFGGIASRTPETARKAAAASPDCRAYDTYCDLVKSRDIDCIYIPLPNHLHFPWILKALKSSKAVLCEKPLVLSRGEMRAVIRQQKKTGLPVQEAFMVKTASQWTRTKEIVDSGTLGEIKALQWTFSYFNDDSRNIRNIAAFGGGGLWDIGVYPVFLSCFLLNRVPSRVLALTDYDPRFGTDRTASGLLDFEGIQSTFLCSTQGVTAQKASILGTKGRLEVEIPFNLPTDGPGRLWVYQNGPPEALSPREILIDPENQYTREIDEFCTAFLNGSPPPVSLKESQTNLEILRSLYKSGLSGRWISLRGRR